MQKPYWNTCNRLGQNEILIRLFAHSLNILLQDGSFSERKRPLVVTNEITSYITFILKLCTMAHANIELINALRETANRLKTGSHYAWGNHGSCNCGNLLQVITKLDKEEIIRYAQTGTGEWSELAEDYCGVTDAPVSLLINKLEQLGLTATDIHNLEYLEDKEVLKQLPGGFRWLKRNIKEDVIVYFETFAHMLEEKLIAQVDIASLMEVNKEKKLLQKESFTGVA